MELNKEQLTDLEDLASLFMPPSEIAILLKIPSEDHILFVKMCTTHIGTVIYETYQRGKLTTKVKLRRTVIKLAEAGSPAAEPLAEKFIKEQEIDT